MNFNKSTLTIMFLLGFNKEEIQMSFIFRKKYTIGYLIKFYGLKD